MTHLVRAGDLVGLPVVSIGSGEDIAEVRDVVYDADEHCFGAAVTSYRISNLEEGA